METLALPGVILAYKYRQYRQRRCEAANRRVTERELSALHYKIVSHDGAINKLVGKWVDGRKGYFNFTNGRMILFANKFN